MRKMMLALVALSALPSFAASRMRVDGLDAGEAVEAVTNVAFAVGADAPRRILLELALAATPSNDVEVAFGYDADQDGILAAEESGLTVGWDCGAWFVRNDCSGELVLENDDDAQSLELSFAVNPDGKLVSLTAHAAEVSVFAGVNLSQFVQRLDPGWNLARVIVRGQGLAQETIAAKALKIGNAVRVR